MESNKWMDHKVEQSDALYKYRYMCFNQAALFKVQFTFFATENKNMSLSFQLYIFFTPQYFATISSNWNYRTSNLWADRFNERF